MILKLGLGFFVFPLHHFFNYVSFRRLKKLLWEFPIWKLFIFIYAFWTYAYTNTRTNAIVPISGISPKIVVVVLSHPVVFASKIRLNAIGSRIAASRITMNILTTASLIAN